MQQKEVFQKIWNDSETVQEVADRLEIKYGTARTKAWELKNQGLYLKNMRKTKTNLSKSRLTGKGNKGRKRNG